MNNLRKLNILTWKKPDLSEFYLATIFAFFLFQLSQSLIIQIARWLISGLKTAFTYQTTEEQLWYCLIIVSFLIVFLLQLILIKPLGLRIDKQAGSIWEIIFTFIMVFGFFIYIMNNVFKTIPMPVDLPIWIIRLFDGWENTFGTRSSGAVFERNFWSVIPWLWILGPMITFYIPVLRRGSSSTGISSAGH